MPVILAIAIMLFSSDDDVLTECPETPKIGRWYRVSPEGAVCADGSQWSGRIRIGKENRVLVYLLGGGVSVDEYSAARSYTATEEDIFYYDRDDGWSEIRLQNGIGSSDTRNPFRDWTIIVIPYTTGDFHAGSGEAQYTALNGESAVIRHRGYDNCMAMLRETQMFAGEPEALLIAGYSAGGFGTAMLADEIIDFFPKTKNVTVCVDGALLINDQWKAVAEERWHTPEAIAQCMKTGNLILDCLTALHEERLDVKILFVCSLRDGGLAKYQSYLDGNAYAVEEEYGERMKAYLRETVTELQTRIPDCGVYIWDDLPYGNSDKLTKHTILTHAAMFEDLQGASVGEWIADAISGKIENYGLHLLDENGN